MAEVGRDLWVHLVQPLLKQRHPEHGNQDHVQVAFEAFQGYSIASGQPVPVLTHLHIKKCLAVFRWNLVLSLSSSSSLQFLISLSPLLGL